MRTLATLIATTAAAIVLSTSAQAQVTLKASHQFPGGKGDVRDDMVQMIAKDAAAANVGLNIEVYPGAALFQAPLKVEQQWDAIVNGELDITLLPLDYASDKVRAFSATLMPGLVRSQDRALRVNQSQFMTDIKALIEKQGVIVLSDAWFGGGMASTKACIHNPDDVKGLKFRAAGPTFAAMWQQAGASIVSVASNEIYNSFRTGILDGTDTSMGSFVSFRLYDVAKCLTVPGENALWMMYEPVLMSKQNFDKLNEAQQDVLIKAGKDAQKYYEGKAKQVDDAAVKIFKDHGVEVTSLTPAEYDAWIDVAKQSSYKQFAQEVPDGQKLIDEALAVK
jgi:TRAP-type C4-dicarboxylate transport system substrate-binding protein